MLHMEKTLMEEIADDYPKLTQTRIRNILAAFSSMCVGNFALFIRDVIAAQITVGLWRFPTSFWMIRTGRTPPCSEPTTGRKSA